MSADPRALAQEAIELAGKATPGPWESRERTAGTREIGCHVVGNVQRTPDGLAMWNTPVATIHYEFAGKANRDLIAHAGTRYATIARALIEALDERDAACAAAHSWDDAHNDVCKTLEHITADRDALLADLPHVLGRCECVREVVARDGRGDPTFGYPEAHTVALAWLNGRIP